MTARTTMIKPVPSSANRKRPSGRANFLNEGASVLMVCQSPRARFDACLHFTPVHECRDAPPGRLYNIRETLPLQEWQVYALRVVERRRGQYDERDGRRRIGCAETAGRDGLVGEVRDRAQVVGRVAVNVRAAERSKAAEHDGTGEGRAGLVDEHERQRTIAAA